MSDEIKDPLEQIFEQIDTNENKFPLELFTDSDKDHDGIAFKTELNRNEHVILTAQTSVNKIITKKFKEHNIKIDLFGDFLTEFKRHKVSLDRKGRIEFTNSITSGIKDNDLQRLSNLSNLTESRK